MVVHMHFSVNTSLHTSLCTVTLACMCAGARGVAQGQVGMEP